MIPLDFVDENTYALQTHDLRTLSSIFNAPKYAINSSNDTALHKIASKYLLEVINTHGKDGRALVQTVRTEWMERMMIKSVKPVDFDDFIAQRLVDFSMPYVPRGAQSVAE
jgi:hypothetical protein